MERHVMERPKTAGVALLAALGLLVVFVALGSAWYNFMMLDKRDTALEAQRTEARIFARAGLQAAAGSIEKSLATQGAAELTKGATSFQFPIYIKAEDPTAGALAPNPNYRGEATVTVVDECSKVNLNHAPVALLMQILGVSSAEARKIRNALPGPGAGPDARWFTSVDELVSRGLLDVAKWKACKDLLTVSSVVDPANPVAFINVNTAPPEVLAAVLGVTPEVAAAVAQKRPFTNLADLSAAAGKDATAFNLKLDATAPGALPKELAFESRCFRIASAGKVIDTREQDKRVAIADYNIEAVVALAPAGATAPAGAPTGKRMVWTEWREKGNAHESR